MDQFSYQTCKFQLDFKTLSSVGFVNFPFPFPPFFLLFLHLSCGVGAAGWEDLRILSPGFSVEWNWMQTLNKLKENFISTSEGISHWSLDEAGL